MKRKIQAPRVVFCQASGFIGGPPHPFTDRATSDPECRPDSMRNRTRLAKRVIDVTISISTLLILWPLMAVIACAVYIDSRGPVLYYSERVGYRGKQFRCLKFRTMSMDADQHRPTLAQFNERSNILFKIAKDPRVSRVGKFLRKYSLDELPQLLNVLKGEMSLVGPRPPLADEVKRYEPVHYRRLEVLPGITGLWQVQSRQDPSFETYISLDMHYVEHWNLLLDLRILLRTIAVVLNGTGS